MGRTEHRQEIGREWSGLYILFLAGISNFVFVDVSLAGMPIRTLVLLLADFLCIAVRLYQGEIELSRLKACGMYERALIVLLGASVLMLVVLATVDSDAFWIGVNVTALLLVGPCIYDRKKFPQEIFCVYSTCSGVVCIVLLINEQVGGFWESVLALLIRDHAVAAWLVLTITLDMTAYCFQERGQLWYGGNILLASFLLALQKNVYGMTVVSLVPLMIPVFCRPSKALVRRAAQAGLMYFFLISNMSLVTGYIPLVGGIVSYDLESSVYLELVLAVMGVWFCAYWDRYARQADEDATVPQMRVWCRRALTACLVGSVGIMAMAELFRAEETPAWNQVAKLIANDIRETAGWESGLFGQLGKCFGIWGGIVAGVFCYMIAVRIYDARRWRVRAHKIYRLIAAVFLLQALVLPQTMASLPVYAVFFFLFMQTGERQRWQIQNDITGLKKGEGADEAGDSDPLLQRGGDAGDCIK